MILQSMRSSPTFESALNMFRNCIVEEQTYLKKDSIIIFTCGERPDPKKPGERWMLMEYAKKNLKEYNFFIAEKIFDIFQEERQIDLLSVEEELAKYSDCIIIILKTVSTFAELGAFMIKDSLADIVLVINSHEHNNAQSFISLGPLAKLNIRSKFAPVVYCKYKNFSRCFETVQKKLSSIKRYRNKKLKFGEYAKFNSLLPKHKLLFIADLVSLYSPISYVELINILKFIFGKEKRYDIKLMVKLLEALDLLILKNGYYLRSPKEIRLFYDFRNIDSFSFRSTILNNYYKYAKQRYDYLLSCIE